jgi:predicted transcriptional regulator
MEVLWQREGWMTPGEMKDALPRGRVLAYTTVMTVLVRLWKKGLLERQRDGRAFAYHPVESREQWTARRMEELLAAAGNPSEALSHFVGVLKPVERDQLRRILQSGRSA